MQEIVPHQPDRHEVDAQRTPRLVDDRSEQLPAIVRRGELLGDAEDTVQPLGKLGFAACEGGLERLRLGSSERDRMRTDDTTSGVSTRPEACVSSIAGSHTR